MPPPPRTSRRFRRAAMPTPCEAAFRFYEQALGGRITAMMTFGDGPMAEQTPTEPRGQIMHALLVVGDNVLMGSDALGSTTRECRGFRSRSMSMSRKKPTAPSAGRGWHGHDANSGDVLGTPIQRAGGPLRHAVDGQLRKAGVTARRA